MDVRKAGLILLSLILVACGVTIDRPSDESLRAQLEVLLNRADGSDISWSDAVLNEQLKSPLPRGKAVTAGWMIEWEPKDAGLAYAIIPWSMLGVEDPKIKPQLPYSGGEQASQPIANEIGDVVISGLDPKFRYLVKVHSVRTAGNFAAFYLTTLLPVADDAYGFAEKVDGVWEVRDLGSAEVGCGLVPNTVLNQFKVRCSS